MSEQRLLQQGLLARSSGSRCGTFVSRCTAAAVLAALISGFVSQVIVFSQQGSRAFCMITPRRERRSHHLGISQTSARQRGRHVRAAGFDEGLSVAEMLRRAKDRSATAAPAGSPPASSPAAAAPAPEVMQPSSAAKPSLRRLVGGNAVIGELPCVFSTRQEGERALGDIITVAFFEVKYQRLWKLAKDKHGGVFAIRYQAGNARSSNALVLRPPSTSGLDSVSALNMGLFKCTVTGFGNFPIVELLVPAAEGQERSLVDPAELHTQLRSLPLQQQQQFLANMPLADRLSLIEWYSNGLE